MSASRPVARDGRILGLDYGGRRIGVAVSDPTRIIALGQTTLVVRGFDDAVRQVLATAAHWEAVCIVLGMPLTLRGDEGDMARVVRRFATTLGRHGAPPVVFADERLTSAQATRALREMGQTGDKAAVDRAAATLLLQTALDTRAWERTGRIEAGA